MTQRFLSTCLLVLLGAASVARAEDDLFSPKPAHLPDLGMEVHHDVPDAGPAVDAGPTLLSDGGLAPIPPPSQVAILQALADQQPAITACIEAEQRHHPGWLATKVTAGFTLTPHGTVTGARLGDAKLNKSKLGVCLRTALGKVTVPAFDGESLPVEVPLVLRHRGSGEPSEQVAP